MSDFWARRKAAVEAEAERETRDRLEAEAAAQDAALAEHSDEELLAEAGQPVPEELQSAEDVQEFLKSALPQRLKTRAMRRLWRLNPVLANLDGLVDYGEDYTDAATVIENLQTTYQVGKGMLAALQAPEVEPVEPVDEAEEDAPLTEPAEPELVAAAPVDLPDPDPRFEELEDAPAIVAGRRMHFRFDAGEGLT